MKKLLVFTVIFALVAGAAFADASVGGNMKVATDLIKGDNGKKANGDSNDIMAGGTTFWDTHTNVSWSGEDAGGMMRLHAGGQGATPLDWTPDIFAFWWWRPIEQLKLQMGKNPDGDFGHQSLSGWGYNAEAQGGICVDEHRGIPTGSLVARNNGGWFGGFGGKGLALFINPIENLFIGIGIPYEGGDNVMKVYMNTALTVNYTIDGIGIVRVAADLGPGKNDDLGTGGFAQPADYTKIFFSFQLIAIDGLGAELGVGYSLAATTGDNTRQDPLGVGLGVVYSGEGFGVKFRAGAKLIGSTKTGSVTVKDATVIGVGILPYYDISDSLRFFLNAGFGMQMPEKGDSVVDWFVNPYIRVGTSSGQFYAGFKLIDNGAKDGNISWSIPIGMNMYF